MAASVLVLLAIILLGEYTRTRGQLLLTALVLAVDCLSALPSSALYHRGRWALLGVSGTLTAGACFGLVVLGIWLTPSPDAYWKAAAIASVLAATTFFASLCVQIDGRQTAFFRIVLLLSLGAVILASLMSVCGILFEVTAAPHWWTMVLAMLAVALGAVTLLLARVTARAQTNAD